MPKPKKLLLENMIELAEELEQETEMYRRSFREVGLDFAYVQAGKFMEHLSQFVTDLEVELEELGG